MAWQASPSAQPAQPAKFDPPHCPYLVVEQRGTAASSFSASGGASAAGVAVGAADVNSVVGVSLPADVAPAAEQANIWGPCGLCEQCLPRHGFRRCLSLTWNDVAARRAHGVDVDEDARIIGLVNSGDLVRLRCPGTGAASDVELCTLHLPPVRTVDLVQERFDYDHGQSVGLT